MVKQLKNDSFTVLFRVCAPQVMPLAVVSYGQIDSFKMDRIHSPVSITSVPCLLFGHKSKLKLHFGLKVANCNKPRREFKKAFCRT